MSGQRRTTARGIRRSGAFLAFLALSGCNTGASPSQASLTTSSSQASPAPSTAPSASPDAATLLGAPDLERPLTVGSYRVGAPFDVPFSIGLPTEWTLKSLSNGDVSFLNTQVNGGEGAAWITIDRVDTVYDDPCHGGPITPPVPSTVDGLVTALTHMVGFPAGPVADVVLDGHPGKSVQIRNDIDTGMAGCIGGPMLPMWMIRGAGEAATAGGGRENLWIIDVDGAPLIIDGTMFPTTPEASLAEIEQVVQTLRFGSTPPAPVPSIEVVATNPGLVDIGGRSLFMDCRGAGSPTVIFLAGTRVSRTAMRPIEDALLGRSVRVCDYDRAGEGQSPPATEPQNDLEVVDDLAALLTAAGIAPPYVLVGHSVGGDQTWLYANRHPDGLAGFLIMNAGFFELDWEALHDVWSDAEIDAERATSEAGLGSVKQAASPPKGIPYVVMMSTIAQCASATDMCGRIYPFFEDWGRELARRTGDGRLVSVESSHDIFVSRPDRVIAEIETLLDDVR